jgi:hypothetical protein
MKTTTAWEKKFAIHISKGDLYLKYLKRAGDMAQVVECLPEFNPPVLPQAKPNQTLKCIKSTYNSIIKKLNKPSTGGLHL